MLKKLSIVLTKGFVKEALLCITASLIVANSSILGFSSPVGVAVAAVLPLPLSFTFTLSSFAFELLFNISAHSLGTVFASLTVCLIRLIQAQTSVKKKNFTQSALPFASYLICTLLFLILFSSSFSNYLATLVFSLMIPVLVIAYNNQSSKQMMSLLFVTLIITFASVDLVYLNIGRAVGIYSVLAIGFTSGAAVACFLGVLCAVSVSLYNPAMFQSTIFVCLVGIICSGRAKKDKLRVSLYAIATAVVCAFLSGVGSYEIGFVVDTVVAVSAFIFTEGKLNSFIKRFALKSDDSKPFTNHIKSYSHSHAYSLTSLIRYIQSLSNASTNHKPIDISSGIYSAVCLQCENHNFCFSDRSLEFSKSIKGCNKPHELISYAEKLKARNDYTRILYSKRRVRFQEALSVTTALHDYVLDNDNLSRKTSSLDTILTQKLTGVLNENKAEASNLAVFSNGSLYIEYPKHKRISEVRLCLLVSEFLSIDYPMPEVSIYENFVRYTFTPKPKLCADFGAAQITASGEDCGDSYDFFTCGNMLYGILCDGMGTGKTAKVSSALLISLIKQQVTHEVSAKAAISLSSLLMRLIELDESFSTLDMLCVNLETGECEFFKSGSCRSFIIGEGITDIPTGGYPIGILSDNDTKHSQTVIKSDTVIVMFTDGAKDIPYQLIEKTVHENFSVSSEEIAEKILENSQKALNHSQNDDITIAVIKIENRKQ